MRRVALAILALAAVVLAATSGSASGSQRSTKATKITIWVGWSARELKVFKRIVSEYDQAHPNVDVKVVGRINDDKITAAIRSGRVPDVVSSFTSSNVGTYCGSGGWIDLAPLMKKSGVSA